ncbi:MAG: hypothetical protein QXT17_09855 [Thermofilum sp.]
MLYAHVCPRCGFENVGRRPLMVLVCRKCGAILVPYGVPEDF